MIDIAVNNQQSSMEIDAQRLTSAARKILEELGPPSCQLSIAVVDNESIHALNRQYLQHDYATDVLSFLLEEDEKQLEGEVIVSAEMAQEQCQGFGWTADNELLLYVIHGVLHLVGLDDRDDEARAEMRAAEKRFLASFGL
jgi:probable rRNA maturation factor